MFAAGELTQPKLLTLMMLYAAAVILTALPMWGAVKCVLISRRPTTNTKAALSLAVLFISFAFPGLMLLLAFALVASLDDPTSARNLLTIGGTIVILVLLAMTTILSILGLVEIKRDVEGRYVQGRRQAIWALSICMVLVWVVFPFGGAVMREIQQRRLAAQTVVTVPESEPLKKMSGGHSQDYEKGRAFGEWLASRPMAKPTEVSKEELNFRIHNLAGQWISVDAKHFNRDATLAFIRKQPEVYLIVIAEAPGAEIDMGVEKLADLIHENMLAASPTAKELNRRKLEINRMEGIGVVHEANMAGIDLVYVRWLYSRNGYVYQLIASGRREDRAQVEREADVAFRSFEMIDLERVCHTKGIEPLKTLSAAEYGLHLEMDQSGWRQWQGKLPKYPGAEFCGLRDKDEGMAVLPVDCRGVQLSMEAQAEAFLTLLGCEQPQTKARELKESTPIDGTACYECGFQTRQDLNLSYQMALIEKQGCACCVATWSTQGSERAQAALEEVLARLYFKDMERAPTFSTEQRKRHSAFYNLAGLQLYRMHQAQASQTYFLRALDDDPTSVAALVNYVEANLDDNSFQPALDALEQHRDLWSNRTDMKLSHAWALTKTNHASEALQEYEKAFAEGAREENHFATYVRLLEDAGQREAALTAIDKYLARGDSLAVNLAKARCLSNAGKHEEAITLVKACQKTSPGNVQIAYALIESLEQADHLPEALETAKKMIADGTHSTDVFFLKGTIELRMKWYKEAKGSFEAAQRQSPADAQIQKYLDHVSAALGEGANVDLKRPIPAVVVPEELQTDQAPAPAEAALKDAPAYYRSFVTAIEYTPNTVYRESTYKSIQVLNETGASTYSTIEYEFDPVAEEVFVNRLEVFDATGNLIAKGDVADYFVEDEVNMGISSTKKTLHVPVPGVRPGCRIEFCITKEDIGRQKRLPFSKHYFYGSIPLARETVVVITDPALVNWESSGELREKTAANYVSWQRDMAPTLEMEPYQDALESFVPVLRLVDKQTSWKNEMGEYEKEIKDLLTISDSIRRTATEVAGQANDNEAKQTALTRYVQNQITYKAIEFGRRSYIMNSAERTLRNKYGDCKDHSLLLCQLLQAAGIPAQLALVSMQGKVSDKIPSMDQFDHMVVFVDDERGGRFLDATVKNIDPELRIPYGLAGKNAMVIAVDNPKLITIPDYAVGDNAVEIDRHVRLERDGTLDADDRLTYVGYYASVMRSFLKGMNPGQRKSTMQSYFASESGVQIQDVTTEPLEEIERPLVIIVKYKYEHALQQSEGQLVGRLPAPWESNLLSAPVVGQRMTPMYVEFPLKIRENLIIDLPSGYESNVTNATPVAETTKFFEWNQKSGMKEGQLTITCSAARRAGHFPATEYAEFSQTSDKVRQIFTPSLVLKAAAK